MVEELREKALKLMPPLKVETVAEYVLPHIVGTAFRVEIESENSLNYEPD